MVSASPARNPPSRTFTNTGLLDEVVVACATVFMVFPRVTATDYTRKPPARSVAAFVPKPGRTCSRSSGTSPDRDADLDLRTGIARIERLVITLEEESGDLDVFR